jgi:DNA-binding CsgD family transcriptional regulator
MSRKPDPYNESLDHIYAAAVDPTRWPEALTSASDYLGATGGMVIYVAPPGRGHSFTVLGRLSEEVATRYREHYLWNPWTVAMTGIPFSRPVAQNSLVARGAIRRTGFYADVLKPAGIEDMLALKVRDISINGGIGGFSFSLSERAVERTPESLRRLSRLGPHLTRALDSSLQLGRYADGTRQLTRALELMPSPALLLDAGRRITYANPAGDAVLRMKDGLTVARGGGLQLTAALPAETAALDRALAQALSIASGDDAAGPAPLRLTRPSGREPLLLLLVPLPPPAFAMWELVESARAIVLVIDPEAQSPPMADALQHAFGLTGAEARVAALIGSGLSGPQTAVVLGVSPETVKTHLARCFSKTGVHSQTGLVRLLGMLPRPPGR